MSSPQRVLVVTAEPDDRPSTGDLRKLVEELGRRPGVEVDVWFLRAYELEPWSGTRTVDRLRTWWVAQRLEAVGLRLVADGLRGWRLRRWFRRLQPDLVLLDDGLGDRLLGSATRPPVVAVRRNPVRPRFTELEPAEATSGDIVVAAVRDSDDDRTAGGWLLGLPNLLEGPVAEGYLAEAEVARRDARDRWGVPAGAPLVIGWGEDGWLDGTELFVRSLWHLEHRHGVRAHGVWLNVPDDVDEAARLRSEAERCGVGDRYHLVAAELPGDRWSGDAVFLPYRVPIDPGDLVHAGLVGVRIVTFAPAMATLQAPWVREVELLDLDGAAAALVATLDDDDDEWWAESTVPGLVDRLLDEARRRSDR